MKQNKFWLKLISTTLLLHVALILLTVIEVAIYSYLVDTGKDQAFYEKHAETSGPWISAIFGALFIFLLVRRFNKKFSHQQLSYAIALPVLYLAIDFLLILAAGYQISGYATTVMSAALPKVLASALAYLLYREKKPLASAGY